MEIEPEFEDVFQLNEVEQNEALGDGFDDGIRPCRVSGVLMYLRMLGVRPGSLDAVINDLNLKTPLPSCRLPQLKAFLSVAAGTDGSINGPLTYNPDNFARIVRVVAKNKPDIVYDRAVFGTFKRVHFGGEIVVDLLTGDMLLKANDQSAFIKHNSGGDIVEASTNIGVVGGVTATPWLSFLGVNPVNVKLLYATVASPQPTPTDIQKLSRNFPPLGRLLDIGEKLRHKLVGGISSLLKLGVNPLKNGDERNKIREMDIRLQNSPAWVNARTNYLAYEGVTNLRLLGAQIMEVFKELRPLIVNGQTVVGAPPVQLSVLWDVIQGFRTLRAGAHDVSKCANPSGSHAAEVLRKQLVQLRALGMIRDSAFARFEETPVALGGMHTYHRGDAVVSCDSVAVLDGDVQAWNTYREIMFGPLPDENGRKYIVGAGDSNIHMVVGIVGTMMDVRNLSVPDLLIGNALTHHFAVDDVIFSDAFADAPIALDYWKSVLPNAFPVAGGGERARAEPSVNAFDRSFCFANRFASLGVRVFSTKIILEPSPRLNLLRELFGIYHVTISGGGRTHNGETFFYFRKKNENELVRDDDGELVGMTEVNFTKIIRRYLCYAVAGNIARYVSQLTLRTEMPPQSRLLKPIRYTSVGAPLVGQIAFNQLWPCVIVLPGLLAAVRPIIPYDFQDDFDAGVDVENVIENAGGVLAPVVPANIVVVPDENGDGNEF